MQHCLIAGLSALICAIVGLSACAMPPPTADDISAEHAEQAASPTPAHCDPRASYNEALNALGQLREAAARAIANCTKACSDAMTDRDVVCGRMPQRQLTCLMESHHQQETCAAACAASGVPDDPEIDRESFNPPDPARVVADRLCLQVLGAMRTGQACSGRESAASVTVSYRTIRGIQRELTCYADGHTRSAPPPTVITPWPSTWYLPPRF